MVMPFPVLNLGTIRKNDLLFEIQIPTIYHIQGSLIGLSQKLPWNADILHL